MEDDSFDVVVVGAGVVGTAIARSLAGRYDRVAMLDSAPEVGASTSKANTAILHTGYDATPGTLESELVRRGYELTYEFCEATGVSVERTGAILVAWDKEQHDSLPALYEKAKANGYEKAYLMSPEQVYQELPDLGPGVEGGLAVPDEAIIDPWSVPLGFATDAANRGCELILDCQLLSVEIGPEFTTLRTSTGPLKTRWLVNAAGLGGASIDEMFGYDRLKVHPRRGELLVYDKLAASMAPKIVLAAPSKLGKGVLVSPTIFGNVMLGPTAEDMEELDTATSEEGFDFLISKGRNILPALLDQEVTSAYAGLRAANNQKDYLIEVDEKQRYVIAGAIRSTGLTSAMAVAEHIEGLLSDIGELPPERENLPLPPRMPSLGEYGERPYRDADLIRKNPDYGEIICFCERVTLGEILATFDSPVPPRTLEGLRRRTRAMNGRCQGFFCGAAVKEIFDKHAKGEPRD